jgi:hypothetical protein
MDKNVIINIQQVTTDDDLHIYNQLDILTKVESSQLYDGHNKDIDY